MIFVAPDAGLGQPEMKLGVFAPAASCLLPELIGPVRAIDLLLSGRSITGAEAAAMGMAQARPIRKRRRLSYFDRIPEAEERKFAALRRQGGALRLCGAGARENRTRRAHVSR